MLPKSTKKLTLAGKWKLLVSELFTLSVQSCPLVQTGVTAHRETTAHGSSQGSTLCPASLLMKGDPMLSLKDPKFILSHPGTS